LSVLADRSVRESWQTADSQDSTANDLLDGLGLVLPHPIKEQKFRASIASISTFMTTDSADAVISETPGVSSQDSTENDLLDGLELVLPKEQKFRASMASISTFMTTDSADAVIPQAPTTSSQDSTTANDLLDGLELVLPHSIQEKKFRASMASISTFMTTDSADAVIPQASTTSSQDSTTANDLLDGLELVLPKEQKFRASMASISTFMTTDSADAVIPQAPTTSSQDSTTANDLQDGLELVLPHSIQEKKFRASMASISRFMTTNSADAVIPQTSSQRRSFMPRLSTSRSLSDFDGNDSVPGKQCVCMHIVQGLTRLSL
jgi:hypothetical protein